MSGLTKDVERVIVRALRDHFEAGARIVKDSDLMSRPLILLKVRDPDELYIIKITRASWALQRTEKPRTPS